MKNAEYNTRDVRNTCESKLEIDFRTTGKEYNGWFVHGDCKICRITVPKGRKEIGKGLYHSMATQLALTNSQFDDLLVCPLKKKGYIEILFEKGKIKSLNSIDSSQTNS